jgi:hypothetical protein
MRWIDDCKVEKENGYCASQISYRIRNPKIENIIGVDIRSIDPSADLCNQKHQYECQKEGVSFLGYLEYSIFFDHVQDPL